MNTYSLDEYYKVPARAVYCETFWGWVKASLYCHVWLRLNPPNLSSLG